MEPIEVLTTWVRIPNLSVEYFDGTFLHKVGVKIGRVLRIEKTTIQAERGQLTMLSGEIDLSKPLLSKFWLNPGIVSARVAEPFNEDSNIPPKTVHQAGYFLGGAWITLQYT